MELCLPVMQPVGAIAALPGLLCPVRVNCRKLYRMALLIIVVKRSWAPVTRSPQPYSLNFSKDENTLLDIYRPAMTYYGTA